jgi:hypothetical protein
MNIDDIIINDRSLNDKKINCYIYYKDYESIKYDVKISMKIYDEIKNKIYQKLINKKLTEKELNDNLDKIKLNFDFHNHQNIKENIIRNLQSFKYNNYYNIFDDDLLTFKLKKSLDDYEKLIDIISCQIYNNIITSTYLFFFINKIKIGNIKNDIIIKANLIGKFSKPKYKFRLNMYNFNQIKLKLS